MGERELVRIHTKPWVHEDRMAKKVTMEIRSHSLELKVRTAVRAIEVRLGVRDHVGIHSASWVFEVSEAVRELEERFVAKELLGNHSLLEVQMVDEKNKERISLHRKHWEQALAARMAG